VQTMNGLRRNDAEAAGKAGIKETPLVCIVILNWNGKNFLKKFLPYILASTYSNKRVIVADNASTDDSIIFLKESFPQVEVLVSTVNQGFAKGYNTALRQVDGDYYVLLNNDVEVTPGWIEPVIELMNKDEMIAACQPKILSYRNRGCFEYAGAAGGWLDALGYPFARGRIFDVLEEDKGQYDNQQACFWASGAAMFVRASVYDEVGGLDEYFFAHQEEIDLCWRMQIAGYKVYVQPSSVVYHVGGGTLSKTDNLKTFLNFRNNLIMLVKNLPVATSIRTIALRMLLDAVAAWKGLLSGKPGFFIAILKAYLHFFKWLLNHRKPDVLSKRGKAQYNGWYNSSLVWQHFIKRKNSFSEIVKNK
ncbi:MAG: glycosyltransferase family 2 protein, partial [Ferruginibacter sp.]